VLLAVCAKVQEKDPAQTLGSRIRNLTRIVRDVCGFNGLLEQITCNRSDTTIISVSGSRYEKESDSIFMSSAYKRILLYPLIGKIPNFWFPPS
jgi:hypothetical protein